MQERLIDQVLEVLRAKNYEGLDVDFEFVAPETGRRISILSPA